MERRVDREPAGPVVILAIDTSTAATSVAVLVDGAVVSEAIHVDARRHAEVLAVLINQVLSDVAGQQVGVVACGVGPGPYTGLRVGVSSARALGLAWGIPVVGVCSLDALASSVADEEAGPADFVVATDARRREVYWARFTADGMRIDGPHVQRPAEVAPEVRDLPWFGEAGVLPGGDLAVHRSQRLPHARDVGLLADRLLASGAAVSEAVTAMAEHGTDDGSTSRQLAGRSLLPPLPLYVRRPDAAAQ